MSRVPPISSTGGRQSWRSSSHKPENHAAPRLLLTVIAVALVAIFLAIVLRPRPDRHLRVALIHAGSHDVEAIPPLVYGLQAARRVVADLDAREIRGEAAAIAAEIDAWDEWLDDPDDTFLVYVRGYLLADEAGRPALACSDFRIPPGSDAATGLLPLERILRRLADRAPGRFTGTRLLVLDLEPLAAYPRLGLDGGQPLREMETLVEGLTGEAAENVWVLVAGGPLPAAGWDHQARLPLATGLLLEGLRGAANFDRNYSIDLAEICDYVTNRMRGLSPRDPDDAPGLVLIRGGVGRLADSRPARDAWLAATDPRSADADNDAEADTDIDADVTPVSLPATPADGATPPDTDTSARSEASSAANGGQASAAGRPNGEDARKAADDLSAPAPDRTAPDRAAPDRGTADRDEATGTPGEAAGDRPAGDAAAGTAGAGHADSFWDWRDRFQDPRAVDHLGPAGIAPHLWRALVTRVLHAELESLDPAAPASRTIIPGRAAADLAELAREYPYLRATGSAVSGPPGPRDPESVGDPWVRQLQTFVAAVTAERAASDADPRVAATDALQQAVAIARIRLADWLDYRLQTLSLFVAAELDADSLRRDIAEAETALLHADRQSDPSEISRRTESLVETTRRFDADMDAAIGRMLLDFRRRDPERTWELTRRAEAWLRSPLAGGEHRRRLRAAIAAAPQTVPLAAAETERPAGTSPLPAADPPPPARLLSIEASPSRRTDLRQLLSELERFATRGGQSGWSWQGPLLADRDVTFADQFAAALRIAPTDVRVDSPPRPLVHPIRPAPRIRNPRTLLTDETGTPLATPLAIPDIDQPAIIRVRLEPEADRETRLKLSARIVPGVRADGTASRRLDARWLPSDRQALGAAAGRADPSVLRVSVPARQGDVARLEIRPLAYGDGVTEMPAVEILVDAEGPSNADEIEAMLGPWPLSVDLPRQDRIRLAVRPRDGVGFSRERVSGEEDLPDGVWLRTFAARTTPFRLHLFNDSDRECRVRAWLIRMENPFTPERVQAYWPDLFRFRAAERKRSMFRPDGKISDRFLADRHRLRGPTELALPAGRVRVPLTWYATDPPAAGPGEGPADADPTRGSGAPAGEKGPGEEVENVDVSHGMALVVRMIDARGNDLPGDDQLLWLVPKPFAPENYVDLRSVRYDDGEIQVQAALRGDFDGDGVADTLPEIDQRPLEIGWTEDDQWSGYQAQAPTEPRRQTLTIRSTEAGASRMKVPVPASREESWVRLDVDGWPRALKWVVRHEVGAQGLPKERWDRVAFGSVSMTYPESPRTPGEPGMPDIPVRVRSPVDPVFRGGGKSLSTVLAVDFSALAFTRMPPPEIRLSVDDRGSYVRYWTDRFARTVASWDGGGEELRLRTVVTDLSRDWTTEAQRADDRLTFAAELWAGPETLAEAQLKLTLDSTPPRVEDLRPRTPLRFDEADPRPIVWDVRCVDPGRSASGITRVRFGVDTAGDGQPDLGIQEYRVDPPAPSPEIPQAKRSFLPPAAGTYRVVVQAWDAAGLASQPLVIPFEIRPAAASQAPDRERAEMKRGRVVGRIATGATARGRVTIDPAPPGIAPGAVAEIASGNRFQFDRLPPGDYTFRFDGSIGNRAVSLKWGGRSIRFDQGDSVPLSLAPQAADDD